jgi:vancomycin resistance protein YoaR
MNQQSSRGTGTSRRNGSSTYLGLAGALFVAAGAMGAAYYVMGPGGHSAKAATSAPKVDRTAGSGSASAGAASNATTGPLAQKIGERLAGSVTLKIGADAAPISMRWSDLGAVVDQDDLSFAAQRTGGSTDPVAALVTAGALPVRIDRDAAVAALAKLKGQVDRSATDAHMDLEARTIRDDVAGSALDVYGSLAALETAARTGATEVTLPMIAMPARVTRQTMGIDDISHVLGNWTTHFSVSDKDRNFNLKLAASKLNGHVIPPHGAFSFNDTVGERSEKQGYKIAHVIQAGEMVDGLAGGTCQISTTLFGASFFAGLQIDHVSNHSRPSAYQPIGFDATVVWPDTDLKMTNPYDFPVVIHYRVASGEAFVEILGKQRPYDKVVFEREILEETPFETGDVRFDDALPAGYEMIDQAGFDGYKLKRWRKFYKKGELVKTEHWDVNYKPVTEFRRQGTSTDPNTKTPTPKEIHGPMVPNSSNGYISQ